MSSNFNASVFVSHVHLFFNNHCVLFEAWRLRKQQDKESTAGRRLTVPLPMGTGYWIFPSALQVHIPPFPTRPEPLEADFYAEMGSGHPPEPQVEPDSSSHSFPRLPQAQGASGSCSCGLGALHQPLLGLPSLNVLSFVSCVLMQRGKLGDKWMSQSQRCSEGSQEGGVSPFWGGLVRLWLIKPCSYLPFQMHIKVSLGR